MTVPGTTSTSSAVPRVPRGAVLALAGAGLLAIGLAVGVPLSLAAARLFGKLLYGVGPSDPLTLVAVVATLAGVAWVSAWIPALRATRIDPASALRAE